MGYWSVPGTWLPWCPVYLRLKQMKNDPLSTYLNDHLAGATMGKELVEAAWQIAPERCSETFWRSC